MKQTCDATTTLQVVNWDQYFNMIVRERTNNHLSEYNLQNKLNPKVPNPLVQSVDWESKTVQVSDEDEIYTRSFVKIEEMENPSEVVLDQLYQQLGDAGVGNIEMNVSFQEAVETLLIQMLEHFVDISSYVIVEMGLNESNTEAYYMLAPSSREELVIRMMNFSMGALVIYKPKTFNLFSVKTGV